MKDSVCARLSRPFGLALKSLAVALAIQSASSSAFAIENRDFYEEERESCREALNFGPTEVARGGFNAGGSSVRPAIQRTANGEKGSGSGEELAACLERSPF